MTLLRHGIWHTTDVHGMLGILQSGEIRPNFRGIAFSHSQTANSYAFFKGYVALFDFDAVNDDQYAESQSLSGSILYRHKPVTFAIELERAALGNRLIPNSVAVAEVGYRKIFLPHVEAWHDGPIPLSAATRCAVIPAAVGLSHTVVAMNDPRLLPDIQAAAVKVSLRGPPSVRPKFLEQLQEWDGGSLQEDDL